MVRRKSLLAPYAAYNRLSHKRKLIAKVVSKSDESLHIFVGWPGDRLNHGKIVLEDREL